MDHSDTPINDADVAGRTFAGIVAAAFLATVGRPGPRDRETMRARFIFHAKLTLEENIRDGRIPPLQQSAIEDYVRMLANAVAQPVAEKYWAYLDEMPSHLHRRWEEADRLIEESLK